MQIDPDLDGVLDYSGLHTLVSVILSTLQVKNIIPQSLVDKVMNENDFSRAGRLTYGQILQSLANVSLYQSQFIDLAEHFEKKSTLGIFDSLCAPGPLHNASQYHLE
jgi:Ca2+-binding EF-hand superfamily protein